MIQTARITVPPNTPEKNPVETVLRLTSRNLRSVSLLFPSGCVGAVGIRLSENNNQFAPLEGWIYGENQVISWAENKRLPDSPRISIFGYSLAEDWSHTIDVTLFLE